MLVRQVLLAISTKMALSTLQCQEIIKDISLIMEEMALSQIWTDGIADNDRIPFDLDGQSVDLGDYDNDGDLDLIIGSKVFRTNADLTFTWMEAITLIEPNYLGKSKWGDFDNDGLLDLYLMGESSEEKFAKIYRNQGNSVFSEIKDLPFKGLSYGSVDLGDYDKDGDLDLIITGWTSKAFHTLIFSGTMAIGFLLFQPG
ncbi:MAG: VCBS repeat-containing protein [Bacteroidetes bacterium]|nr:VCBS repeat-containing protein [Bacteroidota bacterium]